MGAIGLNQDEVWKLISVELGRQGYDVEDKPCYLRVRSEDWSMDMGLEIRDDMKISIMFNVNNWDTKDVPVICKRKTKKITVELGHESTCCGCMVAESDKYCPNCGCKFKEGD